MAIRYSCPVCKASYVVDDWEAGKKSDCEKCGQRLQVPAAPVSRARTVLGEFEPPPPLPPPPPKPKPKPVRPAPPPVPRSEPVPMPSYLSGPKRTKLRTGPLLAGIFLLFLACGGGVTALVLIARQGTEPSVPVAAKTDPAKKAPPAVGGPREEAANKSVPKTPTPEKSEPPPPTQPLTGEQVYEKLVRSSVFIITPSGSGTGFVVSTDKRLLVTNFHVVGRETEVAVLYPLYDNSGELITDAGFYRKQGKEIAVRGAVIDKDSTRDLALIQVDKIQSNTLAVALAGRPAATGSTLFSVGNSGVAENLLWRLTKGTVRGRVQRKQKAEFGVVDCVILESDAPLNHGDSGGPVMNDRGELVAVVSHGLVNQRSVSGNIDVEEVRKFVARHLAGK